MTRALDAAEKIDYVGLEGVQRAIDAVNDFFPDYGRSSPFQRQVLRRFFPFVSFLRHTWGLVARLPLDYPGRGAMVHALAEMGTEYQRDRFATLGVDIDIDKAPLYRRGQVPVRGDDTSVTAWSSGGFNPLGAMGLTGGEVLLDPNASTLARSAAMQTGPLIQAGLETTVGRKLYNMKPFTHPDVVEVHGRFWKVGADGEVTEVPAPTPSALDIVTRNIPHARVVRAFAQPYETFDLPGEGGDAPRPLKGSLVPRRRSGLDELRALLGSPERRLDKSEFRSIDPDPATVRRVLAELSRRRAAAARAAGTTQ